MRSMKSLAAVSLVIGLGFLTQTAEAQKAPKEPKVAVAAVNCADPKQSVQSGVDKVVPGVPTTIFIEGTCVEDVTITKDDVTLNGDPNGDTVIDGTISGTITIVGARRVVIDFLTVTGPGPGVVGTDTAAFTVQNSNISNNSVPGAGTLPFCCDGSGIVVTGSSSATITDSTINNNNTGGGDDEFGVGIVVTDGSSALITNNEISGNQGDGIFVGSVSSARVEFNTITGNGRPSPQFEAGIDVARSGVVRTRGNTITDNGYAAIQAFDQGNIANGRFVAGGAGGPSDTDTIVQIGCTAGAPVGCGDPNTVAMEFTAGSITLFRNAAITGTVSVGLFSTMRIRTSTITGDINVFTNAGVRLKSTMDFTGTLQCSGGSFTFFGSAVQCGQTCAGDVTTTCAP